MVGGVLTGFRYADEWNCECIQVYITPSRRWDVPELSPEEVVVFKSAWHKSKVKEVVAHVPLLVNLASIDNSIRRKSIIRLSTELTRANSLDVHVLVLHPGFWRGSNRTEGIERILDALNTVLEPVKDLTTKIALETMAGQGGAIGCRFEEMASIFENVSRPELVGVCFDIAHVFIAGYYISGYQGYEATLKEFDDIVGIQNIKVIHVSDSKTRLGSRNDRHASIGEGQMGLQVFHSLVGDPRFVYTPKILEIPERDEKSKHNLDLLRKLQESTDPIFEPERPRQLVLEDIL